MLRSQFSIRWDHHTLSLCPNLKGCHGDYLCIMLNRPLGHSAVNIQLWLSSDVVFITTTTTTTSTSTTTTTKPFVPSIWGRIHEPKENYAGSGTWISFLHSFLLSNMPSLRPLAAISCRITSIHVFFSLPCALLTCPKLYALLAGLAHL